MLKAWMTMIRYLVEAHAKGGPKDAGEGIEDYNRCTHLAKRARLAIQDNTSMDSTDSRTPDIAGEYNGAVLSLICQVGCHSPSAAYGTLHRGLKASFETLSRVEGEVAAQLFSVQQTKATLASIQYEAAKAMAASFDEGHQGFEGYPAPGHCGLNVYSLLQVLGGCCDPDGNMCHSDEQQGFRRWWTRWKARRRG